MGKRHNVKRPLNVFLLKLIAMLHVFLSTHFLLNMQFRVAMGLEPIPVTVG